MTEDPVKLYVVVMSILLCVLGGVAWTSHKEAQAYVTAIENADTQARRLREYAAQVNGLCDQLQQSKLGLGEQTLIARAATDAGLKTTNNAEINPKRFGRSGRTRRFKAEFSTSRGNQGITRSQLADFCRRVERYSQGALTTLEIEMNRLTGRGQSKLGEQDRVVDERYRGYVIFGMREIES